MDRIERRIPLAMLILLLLVLLLLSCFCGLKLGYLSVEFNDIWEVFRIHIWGDASALPVKEGAVEAIWDLRLPRILLALCVGMGLSLSGIVMQAIFHNPMADPYIMGISSGASLGAACTVFLGIGATFGVMALGIGAFVGALILSLLLIVIAGHLGAGYLDVSTLLIFGVALAAVCGGLTSVLIFSGANSSGMDVTLYWLMGSVSFAKFLPTVILLGVVLFFIFFFSTQTRILNLMLEGEETAIPLGINLRPFIRLYLLCNALLTGSIVMNAGLIGFVGLLIPHFCRMVVGADHGKLIPVSILVGGIVAVWADILGRTLLPNTDIPLGVTLALVGAPAFVIMLIRRSYRFGEDAV